MRQHQRNGNKSMTITKHILLQRPAEFIVTDAERSVTSTRVRESFADERNKISKVLAWEQLGNLVLTAAWFGLLTGEAEIVVLASGNSY